MAIVLEHPAYGHLFDLPLIRRWLLEHKHLVVSYADACLLTFPSDGPWMRKSTVSTSGRSLSPPAPPALSRLPAINAPISITVNSQKDARAPSAGRYNWLESHATHTSEGHTSDRSSRGPATS